MPDAAKNGAGDFYILHSRINRNNFLYVNITLSGLINVKLAIKAVTLFSQCHEK